MKIVVESRESWELNFFEEMREFRNRIHQGIITSFPEEIEDYRKFFGLGSPFEADYHWCAFLGRLDGKVVAKAILSWRKGSDTGNLGFLDWVNNEAAAVSFISQIEAYARDKGLGQIKTPVDLSLFIKYRIRLPGGGDPFYGEPIYPYYYHDLYRAGGFEVIGTWDTYRLKKFGAIKDFFQKRMKLARREGVGHTKAKAPELKTSVRSIRMEDWENELRIIHALFCEAYQTMPEFEPISFEQFKLVYDDFKYIIVPWMSYIVELQGRPVGFSINYPDPLPILAPLKGKKLNLAQKAILLARLRTNLGCVLIAHIGRIPGPNGEEIKGIQIQVSKRIQIFSALMGKILVTFQNIDSPSRKTWNPAVQEEHARYVLYGKSLK
jgi:hypothetical protein